MKITYRQVYSDYCYLRSHGLLDDFCGVCCNTDLLDDILTKKRSITEALIHLIGCFYERGYDENQPNCLALNAWLNSDKRSLKIKERYNITQNPKSEAVQ